VKGYVVLAQKILDLVVTDLKVCAQFRATQHDPTGTPRAPFCSSAQTLHAAS
jgi:hypothetical protein